MVKNKKPERVTNDDSRPSHRPRRPAQPPPPPPPESPPPHLPSPRLPAFFFDESHMRRDLSAFRGALLLPLHGRVRLRVNVNRHLQQLRRPHLSSPSVTDDSLALLTPLKRRHRCKRSTRYCRPPLSRFCGSLVVTRRIKVRNKNCKFEAKLIIHAESQSSPFHVPLSFSPA